MPVEHDRNPDLKRILKNINQPIISFVVNTLMKTGDNATSLTSEQETIDHTRKNICKDTRGILTVVI
jgi:hypothetical protein